MTHKHSKITAESLSTKWPSTEHIQQIDSKPLYLFSNIFSPDAVRRDGEVLRFGQEFLIESTQGGCPKFILFSSPKCQNLSTAFEPTNMASTGGEIVLPVGVCPKIVRTTIEFIYLFKLFNSKETRLEKIAFFS